MRILLLFLVVASSATLSYGRRVEVPFGLSKFLSHRDPKLAESNASSATGSALSAEPSIVHVATNYDPNNIASAAHWKKNADKGGTLRCLLDMTDEQAGKQWPDPMKRVPTSARSKWRGTLQDSLKLWYWHGAHYEQDQNCDFSDSGKSYNRIGAALAALGLNDKPTTSGGKNYGYALEHFDHEEHYDDDEPVPVDDQMYALGPDTYTATGAHYRFVINAEQGALSVQSLDALRYAAKRNWDHQPKAKELPDLQFAFDILAGYWLRTPTPKGLKYYFANNVQNEETLPLINKILKDKGYTSIPAWPGVGVSATSEEGAALLGSPIDSTLAFLLLQHKAELGHKNVSDITIFREYKANPTFEADIQMLFRIVDVPDWEMLPEDTEMVDVAEVVKRERREDEVVLGLGKNIVRVHEMSLNGFGEMKIRSGRLKREL